MDSGKLTCIIAEDRPELIRLLLLYAEDAQLLVMDTVKSGKALVESVRKNQPDILLVDISLEQSDGLDATKQIIDEGFTPQIVIISGSTSPNHLMTGIKLGTIDYLQKPVQKDDFLQAVRKADRRIRDTKLAMKAIREGSRLIVITQNYRDVEINEQEILLVEKIDKRSYQIQLADGTIRETSTNLDRIRKQCSEAIFFPHKSFLVNFNHIKTIVPNLSVEGNYDIVLKNNPSIVPLTRRNYGAYQLLKKRLQPK